MLEQVIAEQVQEKISGKIKNKGRIDPEHRCIQDVGIHTSLQQLMKGKH